MKYLPFKQQLSEYLDGEMGLADKQAFEDALRSDRKLREEYQLQRRIGLALCGAMPEVEVHPYRFRQQVARALDHRHVFFSPQRVFAAAMVVALVVVSLSFGLYIYQEHLIGQRGWRGFAEAQALPGQPSMRQQPVMATMVVEAQAEQFYNRLLVEAQLGLLDPVLLDRLAQQTGALEGAVCPAEARGLEGATFPRPLPEREQAHLSLADAQRLKIVADALTGNRSALALTNRGGELITQQEFLLVYPAGAEIPVQFIFRQR